MINAKIKINGSVGNKSIQKHISAVLSNTDDTGVASWLWQLVKQPKNSKSIVINPTSSTASFTPDIEGEYVILLTVSGIGGSSKDTAICAVFPSPLGRRISASEEVEYLGCATSEDSFYAPAGTVQTTITATEVHGLGGTKHTPSPLASVNSLISDATLDDHLASRPPNGPASGDLSGTFPSPSVVKLYGRDIESGVPANGESLVWNDASSSWIYSPVVAGGGGYPITPSEEIYSIVNTATDRSFDGYSTSIDELADVLGTLILDLTSTGIIQSDGVSFGGAADAYQVFVSENDTTYGYLEEKIVGGGLVDIVVLNEGMDEDLQVRINLDGYLTPTDIDGYAKEQWVTDNFAPIGINTGIRWDELDGYALTSYVDEALNLKADLILLDSYQVAGDYLIQSDLAFTDGYLTQDDLSGYVTDSVFSILDSYLTAEDIDGYALTSYVDAALDLKADAADFETIVWGKLQKRKTISSSTQTFTAGVWAQIGSDHIWDGYSDSTIVDDSTGSITIVRDGYYKVDWNVEIVSSPDEACKLAIYKNSVRVEESIIEGNTFNNDFNSMLYLEKDDVIEIYGVRETDGDIIFTEHSIMLMRYSVGANIVIWGKLQKRSPIGISTQTFGAGTWEKLGSDHIWDGYSDYITVDDTNARLTVVKDGYYNINWHSEMVSSPDEECKLALYKNGSRLVESVVEGNVFENDFDTMLFLEKDDYIEMYGWRLTAGDIKFTKNSLMLMRYLLYSFGNRSGELKVSVDDTTESFLENKLIAGDNVTLTTNNPGGDETLTVAVDLSSYATTASLSDYSAIDDQAWSCAKDSGAPTVSVPASSTWYNLDHDGTLSTTNLSIKNVTVGNTGQHTFAISGIYSIRVQMYVVPPSEPGSKWTLDWRKNGTTLSGWAYKIYYGDLQALISMEWVIPMSAGNTGRLVVSRDAVNLSTSFCHRTATITTQRLGPI